MRVICQRRYSVQNKQICRTWFKVSNILKFPLKNKDDKNALALTNAFLGNSRAKSIGTVFLEHLRKTKSYTIIF